MSAPTKKPVLKLRRHEVTIPTADGTAVAERIPIRVPMEWDAELGEWLLTAEAEDMIETTKARHMGLLMPHEMLELRQRLGLSQQMLGELLQIGAKSWTRWESGKQRPSRSINLLLRALHAGLVSPQQLRDMGSLRYDWTAQFRELATSGTQAAEPVALDLFRQCLPSDGPALAGVEPMKMPA